ncbi:hypothetical protein ACHAWX_005104 [Stephanocyclus meneghinianus]
MITSLLLLLPSSIAASNAINVDQRMLNSSSMASESRRDLRKQNSKKTINSGTNTTSRNSGPDLQSCYYNLLSSSNYDGTLSQSDYLTFLSLQSDDLALRTPWNTTVSSFPQLSPTFVKVYNLYACGDALVGCPSIEGISIENVYDLEKGFLGRFCESVEGAVRDYAEEIGALTGGSGGGASDSSHADIDDKTGESKKPSSTENETNSNDLFTGLLPISFTYHIGNTFDLNANSILTGSNPFNKMKDDLMEGVEEVVKNVVEDLVDGNGTVVYVDGSIGIDSISDVECAIQTENRLVCQFVLSTIDLMIVNHSKTEIELSFVDSLTEALRDGNPIFPMESGLIIVDVGDTGFKPADVVKLATDNVSESNVGWKIPLLASASILAVIGSVLFALLRRNHGDDENKQLEKHSMTEGDVFIGELMENDSFALKLTNNRSARENSAIQDLERGTASTSSSAPSHTFSDLSNRSSVNSCTSSSSPGCSSSSSDVTFASMVQKINTNPFSLQSNASSSCGSSSPVDNLTPGKSPGLAFGQSPGGDTYNSNSNEQCEPRDTIDKYVKTRLSLDHYDHWLSTVAESEDEFSRSDVSSLSEAVHDVEKVITKVWNGKSENSHEAPLTFTNNSSDNSKTKAYAITSSTDNLEADPDSLKCADSPDSPESLGDNIAKAVTSVSATPSRKEFVCDSSVASSKMTDDDGVSSIEVSTITSEVTFLDGPRALLANIGVAFNTIKSNRNIKKPRPFFEFASPKEENPEGQCDISRHLDNDSLEEIKHDLTFAIQTGDWTAVSATALLLAKADPSSCDFDMESSVTSQRSMSTMTLTQQNRVSELSNLVEKGDWRGVLMAVSQYEGASDTESYASKISAWHEQPETTLSDEQLISPCAHANKLDIKAAVEELVLSVVPDEIDNVDEMLLQFSGREDELIESLKIMQRRSVTQHERDANQNTVD